MKKTLSQRGSLVQFTKPTENSEGDNNRTKKKKKGFDQSCNTSINRKNRVSEKSRGLEKRKGRVTVPARLSVGIASQEK